MNWIAFFLSEKALAARRVIPFVGMAVAHMTGGANNTVPPNVKSNVNVFCDVVVANTSPTVSQVVTIGKFNFFSSEGGGKMLLSNPEGIPASSFTGSKANAGATPGYASVNSATNVTLLSSSNAGANLLRVTKHASFPLLGSGSRELRLMCSGSITVDDPAGATVPGSVIASGSIEYVAGHTLERTKQYGVACPAGELPDVGHANSSHIFVPATLSSENRQNYAGGLASVSAPYYGMGKPYPAALNCTGEFHYTAPILQSCSGCGNGAYVPSDCRLWQWGAGPDPNDDSQWVLNSGSSPLKNDSTSNASQCLYTSGSTTLTFTDWGTGAAVSQRTSDASASPAGVANAAATHVYDNKPVWRANGFPQQIGTQSFMINGGKSF